jgi:hypothetical protein
VCYRALNARQPGCYQERGLGIKKTTMWQSSEDKENLMEVAHEV